MKVKSGQYYIERKSVSMKKKIEKRKQKKKNKHTTKIHTCIEKKKEEMNDFFCIKYVGEMRVKRRNSNILKMATLFVISILYVMYY